MDTRKTKLPHEIRRDDHKRNRQLTTIIHHTTRWMEVLFHECNGVFSNINWVSRIMQDDREAEKVLPEGTFGELNHAAQKSIYILKEVHNYIQVMNALSDVKANAEDMVILNESMLLTSVPKMAELNVQYNAMTIKVSRAFAKVLTFLLNKMLDMARQAGLEDRPINIAFTANEQQAIHVCVSSSELFWHHELWEQRSQSSLAAIRAEPAEWTKQMFYELLALAGGKVLSGCTQQRSFSHSGRRPRLATELIQREISAQYLEFSVPFVLERA